MSRSVVIVDDHFVVRQGLATLLIRAGWRVPATAGDARGGLVAIRHHRPEVALIDLVLPDARGTALCRLLQEEAAGPAVLLFTGRGDSDTIREAELCGAAGVAYKAGDPAELLAGLERVAAGERWTSPELIVATLENRSSRRLSPREREVLELLAAGLAVEAAATRLELSAATVQTHVRNAIRKLGATNRAHALAVAIASGEIEPPLIDSR